MNAKWIVKWIAPVAIGLAVLSAACSSDSEESYDQQLAGDQDAVVRQILGESTSETAPDQLLELTRVIIPAGDEIAPHTHPGPQLAIIVSGTLTYTVIDGEATVTRTAGTNDAEPETASSGDTIEVEPGDSLMEPQGMVHMARNDTDEPVIIYLSSLFPEDAPASSPAE